MAEGEPGDCRPKGTVAGVQVGCFPLYRALSGNPPDQVIALESGQLAGYAGDVWFPQPAPEDHPWRTMPHHGMTPHTSGTTLSAQARYAAGVREILECWFDGRPIREEYLIVQAGALAGAGAHAYSAKRR